MSTRWFRHVQNEFMTRFDEFAGKPCTYVEIGCYAGASAEWVCDNVLTHAYSKGYGIDPYHELRKYNISRITNIKDIAVERLAPYENWEWIFQPSQVALRTFTEPIDVLYIDGLHESWCALQDFVLAFPLLKDGSVVIFDDYGIGMRKRLPHVPEAVAAVLIAFDGMIEPLPNNRRQYACRIHHSRHKDWLQYTFKNHLSKSFYTDIISKLESHEAERAAKHRV